MARPRREDKRERKTALAGFHLTPSEMARLKSKAITAGLPYPEYGRRRLLGGTIKAGRDPQAIRDLMTAIDRFTVAIDRVGVNLNQLAHHANRERHLPALQILQAWHNELQAILPEKTRKDLIAKVLTL